MVNRGLRWGMGLLCVSVFFCALMFLPGCNMFGPDGGDTILPAPLATSGDSSVSFNVVLPEPSIRASVADRIRASSDQSVSVTFSITLIDTSTSRSWVVSKTVAVGADGKADASFTGLPDVTVVGEILIDGGTRGGFNEFHGAADLETGPNDLNVSPKGSGLVADITAKLVIKAANNTDLAEKLPRNLATVAKSSAEQVGETGDPLDLEKEAFNNFVSSNLNQATYVKLVIEEPNLTASGKSTWQKPLSELVDSVDYTESNWKFNEVVSQGFGASAYVSIKSLDDTKFALLKINSANGRVTNWLVNEGNCNPVMVLDDGSVVVGGTLGGKPIVFRWNGTSDKVLTSTDSSLSKWATRLDVSATEDIPDPIVDNFNLGAGDRLTCMLTVPATKLAIAYVLDINTGTIISEPRVPTLRVWAQGMPTAISIDWDLQPDAKSYNLYYAPGDTEPDKATSDKIASVLPIYTHTNLPVDTTYKYLVTWVDKDNFEHDYPTFVKATALAARSIVGKWQEDGLPRDEEREGKRYTTTKNHMFNNADGTFSEIREMLTTNFGETEPYQTTTHYLEGTYVVTEGRIERYVTYVQNTVISPDAEPDITTMYINTETGEMELYDGSGKASGSLLLSTTDPDFTKPSVYAFTYEDAVLELVGEETITRYVVLPDLQLYFVNIVLSKNNVLIKKNATCNLTDVQVTAGFSDDSTKVVTDVSWAVKSGEGTISEKVFTAPGQIGTTTLECSYTESGVTKTAEFAITVTEELNLDFAGGDGSETFPYQIANWSQLNEVRNNLNKHFILKNNLTTETIGYEDYASETANEGKGWSPLGDSNAINFSGIFDGTGHKIVALNIERDPEGSATGLFGYVRQGTIKNLTLEDASIKTLEHRAGDGSVGGIAGQISGQSKIDNCHVSGVITNENHAAGGIVGKVSNKSIVSNCLNAASINGYSTTGGIAGTVGSSEGTDEASVRYCSNTGNITGEHGAGGISGSNGANGIIGFCSNTGNISNSSASNGGTIGGIVAQNAGKITNCHSDAVIHTTTDDAGARAGGIAGVHSGSETEGEITKCYSLGSVTSDKGSAGGLVGGLYTEGFIKKSFSHASVSSGYSAGGLVGETSTWHGSISDCYSTGSTVSDGHAGGLVGRCYGYSETIIQNSYSTGKVTGAEMSGGFCAPLNHSASVDSQAINCFWDINTSEQSESYGDEMGKTTSQMTKKATFTDWSFDADNWKINEGHSYPYLAWQNGANIPYASVPSAPEFAGISLSEISTALPTNETYNLADIQVTANFSDSSSEVVTDVSWSVKSGEGTISEKIFTAPSQAGTTILECSHTESGVTKTAELTLSISQVSSDFAGGDGSEANPYQISTWVHLNNVRDNLDKHFILKNDLSSQTEGYNDYAAATANEGQGWSPLGYANAINFSGIFDGAGHKIVALKIERDTKTYSTGLFGYVNNGTIKSLTLKDASIKTLKYTGGSVSVGAIAGQISGQSKIDNCHVSGVITNENHDTGGIAGSVLNNSIVSNCSNAALINGYSTTGGIAGGIGTGEGTDKASVVDCSNTGDIISEHSAGGIAGGSVGNGVVDNCRNTGNISSLSTSNGGVVGGIVANNAGKITNCHSDAVIHSLTDYELAFAGGIAGKHSSAGKISKCYSLNSVTSDKGSAGGLVGEMLHEALIEKSFSQAAVSGGDSAGGLVGKTNTWSGSIIDCYSTGSADSDGRAGGLVGRCHGYSETIIQNSYSTGKVAGAEMSGGFCALPSNIFTVDSQAINCFWDINTSEQSESYGDEMGKTTSQMTKKATFTDWSFNADGWKINEDQSYPYLSWQDEDNIPAIP